MTSVAVIVLDTLRHDFFVKYFDWLDGLQFNNAWSTSHWTGPAHASLLTGRYPSEIGTTVKSRTISPDSALLTERLQNDGYTTRMVTTNLQIFVWDGWDRGFDERYGPSRGEVAVIPEGVIDWSNFGSKSDVSGLMKYLLAVAYCMHPKYRTIQSLKTGYHLAINQSSIDAVHDRISTFDIGSDEFLIANIMDIHAPYFQPKGSRTIWQIQNKDIKPEFEEGIAGDMQNSNKIKQAYDRSVRYVSKRYQELHDDLVENFDYVITLSDHGEHLGEDSIYTHAYGLRPELTRIPVVISGNDIDENIIETPVSLVDIHATIADLANIDTASRGCSLLDGIDTDDRLIEYHGLAEGRREKFANKSIGGLFEQYDSPLDGIVGAEGYAYETHENGLQVRGDWSVDEAQSRLDELTCSIERKSIKSDKKNVSDSIQQRLEDLGYV